MDVVEYVLWHPDFQICPTGKIPPYYKPYFKPGEIKPTWVIDPDREFL